MDLRRSLEEFLTDFIQRFSSGEALENRAAGRAARYYGKSESLQRWLVGAVDNQEISCLANFSGDET